MILEDAKKALRIFNNEFDSEIYDLILSAKADLTLAGITNVDEDEALIKRAIITYCKVNFGDEVNVESLKRSYDEQKSQLASYSPFTDYGDDEDE